jgi:hypothetical protein
MSQIRFSWGRCEWRRRGAGRVCFFSAYESRLVSNSKIRSRRRGEQVAWKVERVFLNFKWYSSLDFSNARISIPWSSFISTWSPWCLPDNWEPVQYTHKCILMRVVLLRACFHFVPHTNPSDIFLPSIPFKPPYKTPHDPTPTSPPLPSPQETP